MQSDIFLVSVSSILSPSWWEWSLDQSWTSQLNNENWISGEMDLAEREPPELSCEYQSETWWKYRLWAGTLMGPEKRRQRDPRPARHVPPCVKSPTLTIAFFPNACLSSRFHWVVHFYLYPLTQFILFLLTNAYIMFFFSRSMDFLSELSFFKKIFLPWTRSSWNNKNHRPETRENVKDLIR